MELVTVPVNVGPVWKVSSGADEGRAKEGHMDCLQFFFLCRSSGPSNLENHCIGVVAATGALHTDRGLGSEFHHYIFPACSGFYARRVNFTLSAQV